MYILHISGTENYEAIVVGTEEIYQAWQWADSGYYNRKSYTRKEACDKFGRNNVRKAVSMYRQYRKGLVYWPAVYVRVS